ncbi:MAG: helix-turn-helix domain-containing protein [Glutamicibacter ardleyensis]
MNIAGIQKCLHRSNKSVAEGSGISVTSFDRKIKHTGKFSIQELGGIADTLGVTPVDLMTDDLAALLARISPAQKLAA